MAVMDQTLSKPATLDEAGGRVRRSSFASHAAVGIVVPVALLLFWEGLVQAGLVGGRLMPPPSRVAATVYDLFVNGSLSTHIGVTLWRVLVGFALGSVVGTLLGALTGYSQSFARFIDPGLQALRAIPSIAWVPLFILWFGIFETSK